MDKKSFRVVVSISYENETNKKSINIAHQLQMMSCMNFNVIVSSVICFVVFRTKMHTKISIKQNDEWHKMMKWNFENGRGKIQRMLLLWKIICFFLLCCDATMLLLCTIDKHKPQPWNHSVVNCLLWHETRAPPQHVKQTTTTSACVWRNQSTAISMYFPITQYDFVELLSVICCEKNLER